MNSLKVGLVVGEGTGPELAKVFEDAVRGLAATHGLPVELRVCPRRFKTYPSVSWSAVSAKEAADSAASDAKAYEAFVLESAALGYRAIFRTAFNAQSIYIVRERLMGVKLEPMAFAGGEFLLVRDEAQGFYAGANDSPDASPDRITRTCEFSKSVTERILDFALAAAAERWGDAGKIDRVVMAYKFHLLDNRFARWVGDYAARRGVTIDVFQPDTMNRGLLRGDFRGNVLVVGANEWLDIMHADLLARHGGFVQEERCTRNLYLDPRALGMTEYQTVHGSADDIAGRGVVNPLATIRAAAAILERHAGIGGVVSRVEAALASVKDRSSTGAVTRAVLAAYEALGSAVPSPRA